MDLEEYMGRNLDVWAQWMAAHTCSKGDLIQIVINYMRLPKYFNIYMQSNQAPAHSVFIYICVQLLQIMIYILNMRPISLQRRKTHL